MTDKPHDLSEIHYTGGKPHADDQIAILVAKWNSKVTFSMAKAAEDSLKHAGVKETNIKRYEVPGTFELSAGSSMLLDSKPEFDAVICIGCVIQGETRHFEFICDSVSQGIKDVGIRYNKPVIFGVLTTDDQKQAERRSGGNLGNKGAEAAVAALEMIDFSRELHR